jgi:glycosyltransferase involved in cell wall biosynthesis
MQTAVVVTSYRWPAALDCVMATLYEQTVRADQVIVADDGSDPSVREIVEKWANKLPIEYVWQKDMNFRAARARNLAIARARAEYLIFVDGDCLLPPEFIAAHLKLMAPQTIVAGGRYLLSRTQSVKCVEAEFLNSYDIFQSIKFLRLPLGIFRDLFPAMWSQVRTCNVGVMRSDIIDVEGFDESYQGWGREDSDLIVRLLNRGLHIRSARFGAAVAHLHHEERSRGSLGKNDARFANVLAGDEYLPERSLFANQ